MIDANVILDVLSRRENFYLDSLNIFRLCETRQIEGHISALSIANIVKILRKEITNNKIEDIVNFLNNIFVIDDLQREDIASAIKTNFSDFEDALQIECAKRIDADYIISRDLKHYTKSPITALEPRELIIKFEN